MRISVVSSAIAIIVFGLAGCSKPKATCSSQEGIELVGQIISDAAEKTLTDQKQSDGSPAFDGASVRATLSKIAIAVENIRTAKEDPNSTKVFCEGSIKISVPPELLKKAEEGRELASLGTVAVLASANSLEQSANVFTKSIEYNVQPTDDGKKIFAELTAPKPMSEFVSEVVGSIIIKPIIEANKIQQAKAEESERLQAEEQEKKQRAEQIEMALSQAKQDNVLASQAIGELWKSIPEDERKSMLDAQRAWIKKKELDCKVDAAAKSTDPSEKEIYRLNCDTAATTARVSEIQQGLK